MRRRVRWAAGLAVVIAAAGCQQAKSAELSEQDIAAIKELPGKWTKAQMASEFATFGTLLADNAALFPANMAGIQGKEASITFLKGFPKLTAFTAKSAEVGGSGNVAYDRGTYSFTTAAAPNAPSMTETGTYLAIDVRQADGSWKVSRDIWHSDSPAPMPAAAPAKK